MQKDLKIGMALGLAMVVAAVIWFSTLPGLSTKSRMMNSQNAAAPQQSPARQVNLPIATVPEKTSQLTKPKNDTVDSAILSQQAEKIKTQKFHIVSRGETLSSISVKYYGSANRWQKILAANTHIEDANRLRPGVKLIIPD